MSGKLLFFSLEINKSGAEIKKSQSHEMILINCNECINIIIVRVNVQYKCQYHNICFRYADLKTPTKQA